MVTPLVDENFWRKLRLLVSLVSANINPGLTKSRCVTNTLKCYTCYLTTNTWMLCWIRKSQARAGSFPPTIFLRQRPESSFNISAASSKNRTASVHTRRRSRTRKVITGHSRFAVVPLNPLTASRGGLLLRHGRRNGTGSPWPVRFYVKRARRRCARTWPWRFELNI